MGEVVIAGKPEHWDAATAAVRERGGSVAAYFDARKKARRLRFAGRPVRFRLNERLAALPVVFAAVLLGTRFRRALPPERFGKYVYALLFVLGTSLLLGTAYGMLAST